MRAMTQPPAQKTPLERATTAAEQLAAEGQPVTARTVRARASVMTTIAAQAAKAWNDNEAAHSGTPEMPTTVTTRLEAIWAEAYREARQHFDAEREGWANRLSRLEAENGNLNAELDQAEQQIAQLQTTNDEANDVARDLKQRLETTKDNAAALRADSAAAIARAEAAEKALTDVLAAVGKPTPRNKTRSANTTP